MSANFLHQTLDAWGVNQSEVTGEENRSMIQVRRPSVDVQVDYYFYVPDLEAARRSWTDDRAFYPSTVTYGLTFATGLVGNVLVLVALLGDRKSSGSLTTVLMMSLAVADLLFLLVCVPYEAANKLVSYWAGGVPLTLCKVAGFVEMLSALASVLNLTAVSVERYIVIVHPIRARSWFTMSSTYKMIAAVWAASLILSSPTLHIMDTTVYLSYNNDSHFITMSCVDNNVTSDAQRIAFAWYQLIVMFLFPVAVIVYCYAIVTRVLWLSTKQHALMTQPTARSNAATSSPIEMSDVAPIRGKNRAAPAAAAQCVAVSGSIKAETTVVRCLRESTSTQSRHRQSQQQAADVGEARKQLIRMLLIIVGVFFICWGPKLLLNVMKKHLLLVLQTDVAFNISLVVILLPYVHSCVNPVIYGFMSAKFRMSLQNACRACCGCCC